MPKDCDECFRDGVREGYRRGFDEGAAAIVADQGLDMTPEAREAHARAAKERHGSHNTHKGEERITARRAFEDTAQEKKKRKKTARDKKMSKALRQANDKARKNNGDFRKGWNQSRCMTLAHKLCGKM